MKKSVLTLFAALLLHASTAQLVADFSASFTTLDCSNDCISFTDLTSGGTPITWQWSFPGAVPDTSTAQHPANICYLDDGVYDVQLIVSDGIDTDTLIQTAYITKENVPGAFVSPDVTTPFGFPVLLNAGAGSSGATFSWFPTSGLSDPTVPNPFAIPINTTTYSVTITDLSGCSTVLEVTVTVIKSNNIFVPAAFSPNSDGYNDALYLYGNNFASVQFSVYDRWGEKVFETANQDKGWDGNYKGEKAAAGVYTYVAVISFADGIKQSLAGKTSLIR